MMRRVYFMQEISDISAHDALMNDIYDTLKEDPYPFFFRFSVDFINTKGRARDYLLNVYEKEGTKLLATLRKGDKATLTRLVQEKNKAPLNLFGEYPVVI